MKNDKQIDAKKLSDALKVKTNVRAGLVLSPIAPHPCYACGLSGARP